MSFGRNPYPAKAEMAEHKAAEAHDDDARRRFYLDAAHQWDRAAEREKPGKYRTQYEENARQARSQVDAPGSPEGSGVSSADPDDAASEPVRPVPRRL
jgi:hypothetical protein